MQEAKKWIEQGMEGFLVRNLESYAALKKCGYGDKCVLDSSLYTWNDEATEFWKKEGVLRNTVPLELNEGELRHRNNTSSELSFIWIYPIDAVGPVCKKKSFWMYRKMRDCLSERPL